MPPKIPPFQPLAPNDQLYKIACKANELFEKGNYTSAILEYSKGLEVAKPFSEGRRSMDFIALLLSNRSASYFMIKDFENARKDAEKCCGLRPYWGKGHYRRAEALCAQSKYDEALYAYETAVKLDPSNHDFRRCLLRTCLLKENQTMGLSVIQLLPGRDIAISKRLSPIQNKINQFAIEMRNFIYIIADTDSRQCMVVDACWDTAGIIKIIKKHNLTLTGMIVTHYHFDHVGGIPPPPFDQFRIKVSGLATMLKKYPHIKAYIHVNDIPFLKESNPSISNDQIYPSTDDLELTLGTRTHLKFIHTPGHSSGSQCVLVNGKRLISGDTLFIGNCGRLDLPGADPRQMYNTLQKLRSLPDFVVVLPGHNYGGDWTTINQEKEIGVLKEQTYEEWIKKKHASLAASEHRSSATTSFDSGVHHV